MDRAQDTGGNGNLRTDRDVNVLLLLLGRKRHAGAGGPLGCLCK
jgi:hypothetical protein